MVQQWRRFLQCPDNKTSLIHFLIREQTNQENVAQIPEIKELLVTGNEKYWKIAKKGKEEVLDLEVHHEVADTWLEFHAAHAAECGKKASILSSKDTDVFLICLAYSDTIDVPIFQKTGLRIRTQSVDTSKEARICGAGVAGLFWDSKHSLVAALLALLLDMGRLVD